jgi:hypothetical protein
MNSEFQYSSTLCIDSFEIVEPTFRKDFLSTQNGDYQNNQVWDAVHHAIGEYICDDERLG